MKVKSWTKRGDVTNIAEEKSPGISKETKEEQNTVCPNRSKQDNYPNEAGNSCCNMTNKEQMDNKRFSGGWGLQGQTN
jgi:hypothetical protein